LNKWALTFAAAAAVTIVGCGGGGGGGVGGPGPGPVGDSIATVNLPVSVGQVNVSYLTGQGRAAGDITAVINRQVLSDDFSQVETILNPSRMLALGGYTHQTINVNVPTTNSRWMDTFFLNVLQLRVDDGFGGFTTIGGAGQPVVFGEFNLLARVLPGRFTSVPIFLDDAMITVENGQVEFDQELFELRNYDEETEAINGFIADYVRFDISNVADRPPLPSGGFASFVYFSGDAIALSDQGPTGIFEVLTPIGFVEGRFGPPGTIGGQPTPGTYSLVQPDPRDLTNIARITSLMGIWREFGAVFNNLGTFEFITFPNSEDDHMHDVVLVARSGAGAITQLYFGQADLDAGTFTAFPISQVTEGGIEGEITGTLETYRDGTGTLVDDHHLVRQGRFTIGGTLPAGFRSAGRFVVFRR
jgi:hypothetical protein